MLEFEEISMLSENSKRSELLTHFKDSPVNDPSS